MSWKEAKEVLSKKRNNFAVFCESFQNSVLSDLAEEFEKHPKFVQISIVLTFELSRRIISFPFQKQFIGVIEQAVIRDTGQYLGRLISMFFHLRRYDIVDSVRD